MGINRHFIFSQNYSLSSREIQRKLDYHSSQELRRNLYNSSSQNDPLSSRDLKRKLDCHSSQELRRNLHNRSIQELRRNLHKRSSQKFKKPTKTQKPMSLLTLTKTLTWSSLSLIFSAWSLYPNHAHDYELHQVNHYSIRGSFVVGICIFDRTWLKPPWFCL